MTPTEAAYRRPIPFIVPLLNPVIRRLLRVGLPFGPNVLLTVRGRSSGLPRTTPVALLEQDGRRFVFATYGEVQWVRNLRATPEATITRGTWSEQVLASELAPEVAAPVLREALAPYVSSRFAAFFARLFIEVPRGATADDYLDEARRHPVFELLAPATA